MRKTIFCFFTLLLIVPLLGGCWNQKELTELAFVMGVGIDKGKHGQKYLGTFQIVIPGNVSLGQAGGGQGLPIAVYSSEGENMTAAARNVTKKIPRRLYYGHTNLLVISEDLAREGVMDIFDILDRNPEFRTTTEIIIAKNATAEEMMSTLTNIDKLPVDKIRKSLLVTENMLGESMAVTIDDFISGLVSKGVEPIVSGFTLTGDKSARTSNENISKTMPPAILQADGLAVFKDGKLTGWISKGNARGVLWILNKLKSTDISLNWDKKPDALSITPLRSKTEVAASIKNGRPSIHISVKVEGTIEEADLPIDLNDPKEIAKIETKVAEKIKQEILGAVREAQKQKSDIFGFGENIHRKHPAFWRKAKENWNERFTDLPVTVDVQTYIRREGVRTLPFWSDMKN